MSFAPNVPDLTCFFALFCLWLHAGPVGRTVPTFIKRNWYDFKMSNIAAELVIHYKVQHVLEKLGIQVEKRNTLEHHKRLYGEKSTAEGFPIPEHIQRANDAGSSYDLNRPIKQARIDLDD